MNAGTVLLNLMDAGHAYASGGLVLVRRDAPLAFRDGVVPSALHGGDLIMWFRDPHGHDGPLGRGRATVNYYRLRCKPLAARRIRARLPRIAVLCFGLAVGWVARTVI